jgi:hypothetical protein
MQDMHGERRPILHLFLTHRITCMLNRLIKVLTRP